MDGTIICQGSFVSANVNTPLNIVVPSGCDWIDVYNYSLAGAAGAVGPALGWEFYWQLGMAPGTGIVWYNSNGTNVVNVDTLLTGGITLYDPSGNNPNAVPLVGNPIATTASSNATRPLVLTGNTAGLAVGSVVRMSNTAQSDVNGIDMVVGAVNPGVSFTLLTATNPLANVPGILGGAGFYRVVNTYGLFYPRNRIIVNITQAANAQVSTAIEHMLTPGQDIRFSIPVESGMIQLNPTAQNNYQVATVVTVVDAYNFTININTTAYTAFTYPTAAQEPCGSPQMVPVGENTAASLSSLLAQTPLLFGAQVYNSNTGLLADSTVNTGFLGVQLGIGGDGNASGAFITGPNGSANGETIYWRAGKSSFGGQ